ncbi:CoA transferase [Ramlibacter sp. AN1015]|uniref:CaiB/BaiF CoA transferase family protein n=1 Tax=Ramlibacter sp. AN1015 TaxID=3133428 RepID=UPI0030C50209
MVDRKAGQGPLAGVRVIDLTSVIMGPFATHILADMGADVIKVEAPEGDSFRNYRPLRNEGMAGSFLHLNRNKRSVVLDLKQPEGNEALGKLIATADVFIHSLRPKAIQRLGYGYERVREINPTIVYCGAFGFGAAGPYGDKAAYDDLIQAGSGLASLALASRSEPAYMPTVLCDKLTGQVAAYAVIAALFQRERTGRGEEIEVPMFETTIEFAMIEHMGGSAFVPPLGEPGFHRVLSPRRKPYRTKDSYACILPYSDRNWNDFFRFTERTALIGDARFADLTSRVQHIDELYSVVEEEALRKTTREWVDFCDGVSIPCMPVLSMSELPHDEHVKAVKLFETAEHPSQGAYRVLRSPISFASSPFRVVRHAPRLGEHTQELLDELGCLDPAPAGVAK